MNDALPTNHHPASDVAAERAGRFSRATRRNIYHALVAAGDRGITCDEIEVEMRLHHASASARLGELREVALAEQRDYRMTRTGSLAGVWHAIVRDDAEDILARVRTRRPSQSARLREQIRKLRLVVDAAKLVSAAFKELVKDCGGCDHDEHVCFCAELQAVAEFEAALRSTEGSKETTDD